VSVWTTGPIRLRQGGSNQIFFLKNLHKVQIFQEKEKTYHAAAGEIRRYREQTARLHAHRVSPVIDTLYVRWYILD